MEYHIVHMPDVFLAEREEVRVCVPAPRGVQMGRVDHVLEDRFEQKGICLPGTVIRLYPATNSWTVNLQEMSCLFQSLYK